MTSEEFIKKIIDNLVTKFSSLKCRYENHLASESHFIEITPSELFNNAEFQDFQINTISEFIEKFPSENMTFISDNDVTHIETVTYEKTGNSYISLEPIFWEDSFLVTSSSTVVTTNVKSRVRYGEKSSSGIISYLLSLESCSNLNIILNYNPISLSPHTDDDENSLNKLATAA